MIYDIWAVTTTRAFVVPKKGHLSFSYTTTFITSFHLGNAGKNKNQLFLDQTEEKVRSCALFIRILLRATRHPLPDTRQEHDKR